MPRLTEGTEMKKAANDQENAKKADLREAHVRTLQRVVSLLTAVQSDLEVLRSEFSPNLHEINTQLDELVQQMKHEALDSQGSKPSHPEQPAPPVPVDPQAANNGGQKPPEDRPGNAQ